MLGEREKISHSRPSNCSIEGLLSGSGGGTKAFRVKTRTGRGVRERGGPPEIKRVSRKRIPKRGGIVRMGSRSSMPKKGGLGELIAC